MRHFKLIIVTGAVIYSHAHVEADVRNKYRENLIYDRRVDIYLTLNIEV